MPTESDPIVGNWYEHTDKGQKFEVVSLDEDNGAISIQYFDGDLDEIDLDASVWRIPPDRMKAGEEHIVNLSAPAVAIIKGQRADPNADPRWVFRSPTLNGKPLSNMALLILLRRMELHEATTAHGLRASFSTWANESGRYRPDVIEACLAHREGDLVRRAYNRAQFVAERRQLLCDWGAFIAGSAALTREVVRERRG